MAGGNAFAEPAASLAARKFDCKESIRRHMKLAVVGGLEYAFIIFTLLSFNTPYSRMTHGDLHLAEIAAMICVVLCLAKIGVGLKRSTLKRWLNYFIPYYIIVFIYMAVRVRADGILMFIGEFIIILPLLALVFAKDAGENRQYRLFYKYSDVMCALSICSLFFWVFATQFKLIPPTGYIVAEWGGDYNYPIFFGVYTQRQATTFLGIASVRNQSIFTEAPMHNFALAAAIMIELLLPPRRGRCIRGEGNTYLKPVSRRAVLFIVTMITTLSTTGYIVTMMIFVMRYMILRPREMRMRQIKFLVAILVACVGAYLMIQIFLLKSTSYSWFLRSRNFIVGFRIWKENPVFGVGFLNGDVNSQYFKVLLNVHGGRGFGYSNAITQVLDEGGLVLFSVYLIPLLGGCAKAFKKRQYGVSAFAIALSVEVIFTVTSYTILLIIMLAFFTALLLEPSLAGSRDMADNTNNMIKEV